MTKFKTAKKYRGGRIREKPQPFPVQGSRKRPPKISYPKRADEPMTSKLWKRAKKLNYECDLHQEWAGLVTKDGRIIGVQFGDRGHSTPDWDATEPDVIGVIHFHYGQGLREGYGNPLKWSRGDIETIKKLPDYRHFLVGEDGIIEWGK